MRYSQFKSKIVASIMAFLMVCLFLVPQNMLKAKDSFLSQYTQTVYNQKNGIGSNEVNCLYQSSSGYIWIGTDGGLYRSNGSEFQSINLWDTERTDVYSINCIMQDHDGRMWIGTDNYGLFYIENGENYHLQGEYYDGIKRINDLCQTEDGIIYAATSNGLYTCEMDEETGGMIMVPYIDGTVADLEFLQIINQENTVWAINDKREIYVLDAEQKLSCIDVSSEISDELLSISCLDDTIYVGGNGREVLKFRTRYSYTKMTANVEGIHGFMKDDHGYIWAWADNGVGYFDVNSNFNKLYDCEFDGYLSDMIQDYEGNYWLASSRMGILLMSRSKFVDYNMLTGLDETMVNTVYRSRGYTYIGTDDGLFVYDSHNDKVETEEIVALTEMLAGISIRSIMSDTEGNLWISTYRRYGIVKVARDGTITNYGRNSGLPNNTAHFSYELSDGNIAVAMEDCVAIIDGQGNILKTYGDEQGISYGLLCIYEDQIGNIYLGTDGGGIYVIQTDKDTPIEHYDTESGLNSDVVTCIVEGQQGFWIGTDNGLCFYNESFRSISNIEFSNSIYDVLISDGQVFLIGSMGILITTEEELLGSKGISNRYLDVDDGLRGTINTSGHSCISGGLLYVCCNTGIYTLDIKNIWKNEVPPRMKVTAIDVDGTTYEFDDVNNGLRISHNVSRITIDFAVFSYQNRNDMQVEYMLRGFDDNPIVISGSESMEAVYTNLDGGEYEFVINAYNGDGTPCGEQVSFSITKEKSFFEKPIARVTMLGLILLIIVGLIFGILRVRKMLINKNTALEQLSKEHEVVVKSSSAKNDYLANMSNEIKTPVNAMMVKAEELLHVLEQDEENRKKIESIQEIGVNILHKVDDIILLAKIEAGKVEVSQAPYSVTNMIYELSDATATKIGEKAVKFFVEIGENMTDNVIGDEDKIHNILERLLDNAVKYTKEGSITLSVDCYEYADRQHHNVVNLVFTVSDTGIGIQEDRIETLFEVYTIADNVKNTVHSGNGVGLAIAKGYSDLMNGELEVESAYGTGSTFTLSVIQKVNETGTAAPVRSKIEGIVSQEIAEKLWLPEVSCLLVDDEEVSREVSAKTLAQFEMKIDQAATGLRAIDMVMNHAYDVVFMDLSMPIMNGVDAMREIREIEGDLFTQLPIISMDTNAIEENREELLGAGFTDNLVKPIDIRRVAAILKDCLPQDKIKEKTNDVRQYIAESRFSDGLENMMPYIDVEYALSKIGGSIHVFNKLIATYYRQHASAIDELYEKFGKDARAFKTKIHALRVNSMSVGAIILSQEASKIEAAINIGNRDYVKDNLENFTEHLFEVLLALEDYLNFMNEVSGMTDEEYAAKKAVSQSKSYESQQDESVEEITDETSEIDSNIKCTEPVGISLDLLENIKYHALMND
ncbi:MAG: ATP-binding protein, partial [Lachnospiraceae bacterium]|nr:ATP-binding protein [Lachnospiraceae bacterium]